MKAGDKPRFDPDTVRALAGSKAFARGEAYFRDGQVMLLSVERQRVLAQVAGSEDYRTELIGAGKKISGTCSRPAFDDWGFCKHLVAVALAANAAKGEADGVGALARIRHHLKAHGTGALVDMIMDLAERDPALFRKLDMSATISHADGKTLEPRLRKAIDDATRTHGYVDYREAAGWADGVNTALDAVAEALSGGQAAAARKLAERAIERIEAAVGQMDNSDGHCNDLLERARDIHLAAVRVLRPDPVALARDLYACEMVRASMPFDGAAMLYEDVLGAEGLAEYRRLAAEAWAKLPPRTNRPGPSREMPADYHQLMRTLDFFAEREGDVEARIALRTKDLSSSWNYLRLVEFCVAQDRAAEALRRAEEGLWLFADDRTDERLVVLTVELLAKAGRPHDAAAQLWHAFEKVPSLALYTRLRKLGGTDARDRAIAFLQERATPKTPVSWYHPADLLIHVLMQENMFDAAWTAARRKGVPPTLRETLARASEATHPREAVAAYAERVDALADGGGNAAYQEALELITRMAALQSAAEQAAYVAALKVRFGRKRNLMKLLG